VTRQERRNFVKGVAFLSPWMLGFLLFMAVPLALSLYLSFCDYALTAPDRKPVWIGIENYRALLHDPLFFKSLRNTAYYAALSLPSAMLLSLGLALMLNADIRGQAVYRTVIFLPSLLPATASAMIWLWMFNGKFGLFNYLLGLIGVSGPPWLGDKMAMLSLALMSLWGVGNTVVIYLAGLQDIPRELLEAAQIDGANRFEKLIHVSIPVLSPVIFFNLVMAIIGTFSILTVPYIMTQGGPNNATYFYTMYSYDVAFMFLRMGYAAALAWVQFLIVLILTAIAFWSARKWVHYA
jgi:multiple sugar transport system permease protein